MDTAVCMDLVVRLWPSGPCTSQLEHEKDRMAHDAHKMLSEMKCMLWAGHPGA